MTTPRRRGMTVQAAQASIDQACRMLRLPIIRHQFPHLAETAARDLMSYMGSSPNSSWPSATTARAAAPNAVSRPPNSRATSPSSQGENDLAGHSALTQRG